MSQIEEASKTLSANQKEKIKTHFSSKAPVPTCPICNVSEWTINDGVAYLMSSPDRGIPLVLMTCGNCGYMLPFNGNVIGITKNDEEEEV